MTLYQNFKELFQKYNQDNSLQENLWLEIETYYTSKKRHYHTMVHLENLFQELLPIKENFEDWETVQFSIFYHDIIYNASRNDNEEKSAILAIERLKEIGVSEHQILKCNHQILMTKSHEISDSDTNYFTDADLSILGKKWEIYEEYFKQIRKEYRIYPDFMYNRGRKKALKHFLEMERIFKTDHFFEKYEDQAQLNLRNELEFLSK
jgi:predicted metal-dependent HD superfamily phosphohydrolase